MTYTHCNKAFGSRRFHHCFLFRKRDFYF